MAIYTYNWTKDNIDKLIMNCSKLGQWLSVRSCFLNSVTSQKLGLFHNQAITQKTFVRYVLLLIILQEVLSSKLQEVLSMGPASASPF